MAGSWAVVLTTALLGTERRGGVPPDRVDAWAAGVPSDADPAYAVLTLAARHRAAVAASRPLPRCGAGPVAPPSDVPPAPPPAQTLLGRLLAAPQPDLLGLWLAAAVDRGLGAAPDHWAGLAAAATRQSRMDRRLLGAALGAQGRWFVAQNEAWQELTLAWSSAPPAGPLPGEPEDDLLLDPALIREDPFVLVQAPAPWPVEWTAAALHVLASGSLGPRSGAAGAAIGARMPLPHRALLAEAEAIAERADVFALRSARTALAAVDRAVAARLAIDDVFGPGGPDAPEPA